jgi:hypothetical protein
MPAAICEDVLMPTSILMVRVPDGMPKNPALLQQVLDATPLALEARVIVAFDDHGECDVPKNELSGQVEWVDLVEEWG